MTSTTPAYPDAQEMADHWWWRPGWGVGTRFYTWHVTVEDQPELRPLVRAYQHNLTGLPSLDLVPERWLHITTQGVGHVHDVPDDERDAIVRAVRHQLAGLPPATMTFHQAVLHKEAVVIPPQDPTPMLAVRQGIRAGIAKVLGNARVPEAADGFQPHLTVAYSNTVGPAALIRVALDCTEVAPVTTTLRTASLIVLHRDNRMYQWTTAATVNIGDIPSK